MAYGRACQDVARDPWRWTLYAFAMLRDHEQITQRLGAVEDVRAAHRSAVAFHEPKRLADMERRALSEMMSPRLVDHDYVRAKREQLEQALAQGAATEVNDLGC